MSLQDNDIVFLFLFLLASEIFLAAVVIDGNGAV